MRQIELTEAEQDILTTFQGRPLHSFIYRLDLGFLSFRLARPLDVRNFVALYTRYIPDIQQYGRREHWPMSANDVYDIYLGNGDDCDGLAILTASLLHSGGKKDVRLAVGGYGAPSLNHAWAIMWNNGDPLLMETTGNEHVDELPRLADCPEYFLFFSASAAEQKTWRHI